MKQVVYCCYWVSHTLWQREKATRWEAPERKIMLLSGVFGAVAYFLWRKKTAQSWPVNCPCCILAGEISICHPVLILPLCMSQSKMVWLNGCYMEEQWFLLLLHSWWTVSSNCFFCPSLPCTTNFFSLLHQTQSAFSFHMSAKVIKRSWRYTKNLLDKQTHLFFFKSIHYSLLTVTSARPICASRFMKQCGTKRKFVLATWVKDLETLRFLTAKQKKREENLVWHMSQK